MMRSIYTIALFLSCMPGAISGAAEYSFFDQCKQRAEQCVQNPFFWASLGAAAGIGAGFGYWYANRFNKDAYINNAVTFAVDPSHHARVKGAIESQCNATYPLNDIDVRRITGDACTAYRSCLNGHKYHGMSVKDVTLDCVQQTRNECGYVAVSKGIVLLDALKVKHSSYKRLPTLQDLMRVQPNISGLKQMLRESALGDGEYNDEVENLSPVAIRYLLSDVFKQSKDNYTLLPMIQEMADVDDWDSNAEAFGCEPIKPTLQRLQQANECAHLFILGDMTHQKTSGHWTPVVLQKKQDRVMLYTADSKQGVLANSNQEGLRILASWFSLKRRLDEVAVAASSS